MWISGTSRRARQPISFKAVTDERGDAGAALAKVRGDPYLAAARAFFRSARSATGQVPDRVTRTGTAPTRGRSARRSVGRRAVHRTGAYRNNGLEQDHRGVKGRIRCTRGFKSFASAERFCRSHDELRDALRPRTRHNQHVPADLRRWLHLRPATAALAFLVAA